MQQFFFVTEMKWILWTEGKTIFGSYILSTYIQRAPVVILSSTESEQRQVFRTAAHPTSFVVGILGKTGKCCS